MKVVHINTYSKGGAANAAIRLHKGLLEADVRSRMLFLDNQLKGREYAAYQIPTLSLKGRLFRKLINYRSIEQKNRQQIIAIPDNYEVLSFPLTSYKVEDHPWLEEADLINLHWVANFINYPSFFPAIDKPIVWTLHDMNPIRGIFHYEEDTKVNAAVLGELEKKMTGIKYMAVNNCNKLRVVTPSAWLGDLSSNSEIFGKFTHTVIPNGLDVNIFKPVNKKFARQVFNLPEDKIILLFASEQIENRRKGFDLLVEAMTAFKDKDNLAICAVGIPAKLKMDNLYNIGLINDERLMAILYSAADAFILPSREDNLPNVMLEALACGRPVIAFNTGGMKEVITNSFNGFLADTVSGASLAAAIEYFIDHKDLYKENDIRQYAISNFNLNKQAKAYLDIYQQLIS